MPIINPMNFAAFDLNLLRVFDALMRERNVTRAGERLGLSQPAVSTALNRLRAAFADELFVRIGGRMEPTPRVIALAEPIREALRRLEVVVGSSMPFDPSSAQREFVVSGTDYVSYLIAPPLLTSLTRIAPGIVVRLIDSRAPIKELLEAGEADLAVEVMHELPDPVHSHFLFEEKYVVIAGADPSLRGDRAATEANQVFDLELYCRLPHVLHSLTGGVSGNVDAALAAIGRRRHVALSRPHFFTVAQAVAKSGLIATFPERLARRLAPILGLRIFLPPIELAPISLAMIWHRRNDNDAGHLWLRQQVMSVAQGMVCT